MITEELLKQLLEGQKQLFEGQKQITQRLDRMESDITDLKTTVNNIEGQQAENTPYIKALVHRTEELDAKFDGLLVSTATKENIARLEAQTASKDDIDRLAHVAHVAHDINFLVRKAAEHDSDIRRIRKAE